MNNLDIILVVAIVVGFAIGYFKGLISQLSFGAGMIIGLLQSVLFYPALSAKINELTGWDSLICSPLAFVAIILVVVLAFKIVGWLLSALLKAVCLGFVDRISGALFSTAVAVLLVIGVTNAALTLMPNVKLFDKTTQNQSLLYKHVQDKTLSILGEVKEEIDERKE